MLRTHVQYGPKVCKGIWIRLDPIKIWPFREVWNVFIQTFGLYCTCIQTHTGHTQWESACVGMWHLCTYNQFPSHICIFFLCVYTFVFVTSYWKSYYAHQMFYSLDALIFMIVLSRRVACVCESNKKYKYSTYNIEDIRDTYTLARTFTPKAKAKIWQDTHTQCITNTISCKQYMCMRYIECDNSSIIIWYHRAWIVLIDLLIFRRSLITSSFFFISILGTFLLLSWLSIGLLAFIFCRSNFCSWKACLGKKEKWTCVWDWETSFPHSIYF